MTAGKYLLRSAGNFLINTLAGFKVGCGPVPGGDSDIDMGCCSKQDDDRPDDDGDGGALLCGEGANCGLAEGVCNSAQMGETLIRAAQRASDWCRSDKYLGRRCRRLDIYSCASHDGSTFTFGQFPFSYRMTLSCPYQGGPDGHPFCCCRECGTPRMVAAGPDLDCDAGHLPEEGNCCNGTDSPQPGGLNCFSMDGCGFDGFPNAELNFWPFVWPNCDIGGWAGSPYYTSGLVGGSSGCVNWEVPPEHSPIPGTDWTNTCPYGTQCPNGNTDCPEYNDPCTYPSSGSSYINTEGGDDPWWLNNAWGYNGGGFGTGWWGFTFTEWEYIYNLAVDGGLVLPGTGNLFYLILDVSLHRNWSHAKPISCIQNSAIYLNAVYVTCDPLGIQGAPI